ncbi:MAG: four helix bundle protein [Bacteroidetes bacterium]|nr:four helix bundle protein [Bacteroidota bacterium]
MNRNSFENRLLEFVSRVIRLTKGIPMSQEKNIITNQIVRSSISVALNYAESGSAESRKDFIHKLRISLKEMRETHMALKIIIGSFEIKDIEEMDFLLKESNEIISILVSSINTATKNMTTRIS